jgi:hypothetical protein
MAQPATRSISRRMVLAGLAIGAVIVAFAYSRAQQIDVVYVPTPQETVDRMLEVAEVGPKDFLIDLGSGDGRIPISAGRLGARALGIELDPVRLREAEANLKRAGLGDRVSFRRQNLFDTDLSDATVLTMYLLPGINLKLRPRILALRPGTRVVSHDFAMGDWKPDLTETVNWRIHFWVVPARVEGAWKVTVGSQSFDLALTQRYQELAGAATFDGRKNPVRGRLRGAEIDFTIDVAGRAVRFRGAVSGDNMQGADGAGSPWSAKRG